MRYQVTCPHCGESHTRIQIDAPESYTITSCSPSGCIFFETNPTNICRWTCGEITPEKGKFPPSCPIDGKIVQVHSQKVLY